MGTPHVASSDSHIFLVDPYNQDRIQVFDAATGRFVREVGRAGQGPGEFRFLKGLRVYGDTLFAFDQANMQLTKFDSELRYVTSATMRFRAFPYQPFVQSDYGTLVAGLIPTTDAADRVLHLFDAEGRRVASFGAAPPGSTLAMPRFETSRILTDPIGADVLVGHTSSFTVEQWNLRSRTLRQSFTIPTAWLDEGYDDDTGAPLLTYPPLLLDMARESPGRLWVMGRKTRDLRTRTLTEGEESERDMAYVWSLNVDLLDMDARQVLGSVELPGYGGGFTKAGRAFTYRSSNEPGQMQLWVLEARCDSPSS